MATTNPFRLLKGDNEDPTQLAARAPQTNAAVNPFEAVMEATNKTSGGGRRGVRRRGKSRKTSEVAQVATDVNLTDDKPEENGVGDDKDKEMTLGKSSNGTRCMLQLLGMLFKFLCTLSKSLFRLVRYFYASLKSDFTAPTSASGTSTSSATRPDPVEVKKTLHRLSLSVDLDALKYDKCTSTTPLNPLKIEEMLQGLRRFILDPPPRIMDSASGASTSSATRLDPTELKKTLHRLSLRVAAPTPIGILDALKYDKCTSTTPLNPLKIEKILQDLSRVILDPPPRIMDSDPLHDLQNRIAEIDDICITVNETCRQMASAKRRTKQILDTFEPFSTADESLNWYKYGLQMMSPELVALNEKLMINAKRLQKYLLYERCYCK